MTDLTAHPLADLFPRLDGNELDDLAADIKANGLLHPIVLLDGMILDGRNRLVACEIAGVIPTFKEFSGADPAAFVVAENLRRRHLSKGQQAIAFARIYAPNGRWARGTQKAASSAALDAPATRTLREAAFVVAHAPDLAGEVAAGARSLKDAYDEAKEREAATATAEARLATLRTNAPDLADAVVEGTLTLTEAEAAWRQRDEDDRLSAVAVAGVLRSLVNVGRLSLGEDLPQVLGSARGRGLLDVTLDDLDAADETIRLTRQELTA